MKLWRVISSCLLDAGNLLFNIFWTAICAYSASIVTAIATALDPTTIPDSEVNHLPYDKTNIRDTRRISVPMATNLELLY